LITLDKENTMKNLKLGLLITALVSVSSCVSAQDENQHRKGGKPPSVEEMLAQMDMNEDSQLSESEVKGPLKNDFSKIDSNGDGLLSIEELTNAPKPKRGKGPRNRQD